MTIPDEQPPQTGSDSKGYHPEERLRFLKRFRERRRTRRMHGLPTWSHAWVKFIPTAHSIRDSRLGRFLGKGLMRRGCWSFKPHNAALGLGLGVLIAWTPTITIQMAIAAIVCWVLRANIPLAVAVTWITNVVTAIPVYMANTILGQWLLGMTPTLKVDTTQGGLAFLKSLVENYFYPLWVGSLVLGTLLGAMTYFAAYGFAHWQRRYHLVRTLKERNELRKKRRLEKMAEREQRRSERELARQGDHKSSLPAAHDTPVG